MNYPIRSHNYTDKFDLNFSPEMVKEISDEANKMDNDLLYFGRRDGVMVRIRNQVWTKIPKVGQQNYTTFILFFPETSSLF